MGKLTKCFFCKKKIDNLLPFKCKFCGKYFCSKHHLPENHKCSGLEEWKKGKLKTFKKNIGSKKTSSNYLDNIFEPMDSIIKRRKIKIPRSRLFKLLLLICVVLPIEFLFAKEIFFITLYLMEIIAIFLTLVKLFKKAEKIAIESDLKLFSLRLLSGGILLVGGFFLWTGFMFFSFQFMTQISNPLSNMMSILFILFGLGFVILATFLLFKFKRGSGLIVYRG